MQRNQFQNVNKNVNNAEFLSLFPPTLINLIFFYKFQARFINIVLFYKYPMEVIFLFQMAYFFRFEDGWYTVVF